MLLQPQESSESSSSYQPLGEVTTIYLKAFPFISVSFLFVAACSNFIHPLSLVLTPLFLSSLYSYCLSYHWLGKNSIISVLVVSLCSVVFALAFLLYSVVLLFCRGVLVPWRIFSSLGSRLDAIPLTHHHHFSRTRRLSRCRSGTFLVPRHHSGSFSASFFVELVIFSFLDTIVFSLIAFVAPPFVVPVHFLFRGAIPVVFRRHSSWM